MTKGGAIIDSSGCVESVFEVGESLLHVARFGVGIITGRILDVH